MKITPLKLYIAETVVSDRDVLEVEIRLLKERDLDSLEHPVHALFPASLSHLQTAFGKFWLKRDERVVEVEEGVYCVRDGGKARELRLGELAPPPVESVRFHFAVGAGWIASFESAGYLFSARFLFAFDLRKWEIDYVSHSSSERGACPLCEGEAGQPCSFWEFSESKSEALRTILSSGSVKNQLRSPENPFRLKLSLKSAFSERSGFPC